MSVWKKLTSPGGVGVEGDFCLVDFVEPVRRRVSHGGVFKAIFDVGTQNVAL